MDTNPPAASSYQNAAAAGSESVAEVGSLGTSKETSAGSAGAGNWTWNSHSHSGIVAPMTEIDVAAAVGSIFVCNLIQQWV